MKRADVWWEIPDQATGAWLDLGAGGAAISIERSDRDRATFITSDVRNRDDAAELGISASLVTDIPLLGCFASALYEPPQREAKLRVFETIDGAFRNLSEGGCLYLAGRKNRGIESYRKRMAEVFGNAALIGRAGRVRVYQSHKSSAVSDAEPVDPWQTFTVTSGQGAELNFKTRAGVFSSDHFDGGSRLLADTVGCISGGRILDVGCGSGAIALTIASGDPSAVVTGVDVNALAVECARLNALANGMASRTIVHCSSLYEVIGDDRFDLIVSNPPFHEGNAVARPLIEGACEHLLPGGRLMLVVMRKEPYVKALNGFFDRVGLVASSGPYTVIDASRPKQSA